MTFSWQCDSMCGMLTAPHLWHSPRKKCGVGHANVLDDAVHQVKGIQFVGWSTLHAKQHTTSVLAALVKTDLHSKVPWQERQPAGNQEWSETRLHREDVLLYGSYYAGGYFKIVAG